jgi:hypothetical protein
MRKVVGVAVALCLFAAPSALASSVRDTLEVFGFFGVWAPDCSRPPDLDNSWRTAVPVAAGDIRFSESVGENYQPNRYRIISASRPAPQTLVLRIELNDNIVQDLTMAREDGRIRTMTNKPLASTRPVVMDGVILANGQPTPWLTRCATK